MATLLATPYPGNWDMSSKEDSDAYFKRTQALYDAIPQDRIISFHVADGSACYYVVSSAPGKTILQHIPFMDAYRISPAHIRGLKHAEVIGMIEANKAWAKRIQNRVDWWEQQSIGSTVHYNNGFDQYVRGVIVQTKDGRKMKPTALVGNWAKYDLPRYTLWGEISNPYHVKRIQDGETMSPHESSMVEGSHKLSKGKPDPRTLPALDLTPTPMSVQAKALAVLVKARNEATEVLSKVERHEPEDPDTAAEYRRVIMKAIAKLEAALK